MAMPNLPTGTVTFLFTDVEGSTRLWEQDPAGMREATARHDALVEAIVGDHDGVLVRPRGEGDSRFAVFAKASDAVAAAVALQEALHTEPWPTSTPLRVRMALHTGEADLRDGDYYGAAVNRCARLRAIASGGQVLLSQATQRLVEAALPPGVGLRDLGEHHLADVTLPEQVYQVIAPGLPDRFPPLRTLDRRRDNLPAPVTSFVGREREAASLRVELQRPDVRLLTLTGPGGIGKTRLAIELARSFLDAFPDGVWLVELAGVTGADLVPSVVLTALGARETPGQPPAENLVAYLRARTALVVLDNCEHLLDACARLADAILRGCPDVQIVATSREALGISGEMRWPVPPLAAPAPESRPSPALLAQFAAVRLFVERARAVRPTFRLTAESAPDVARVCQQLDGIPLALELAAARLGGLTVEQLATRLDQRFRLLTGGSRAALPRQQTLRATFDWSYALLEKPERLLLNRLAVFAGGWTLEAAEAICTGQGVAPAGVADLVLRLVDKSLVVAEERDGAMRYRLLETVRLYAREKLDAAGEAPARRRGHGGWYLALAEEAAPRLIGPDQRAWLDRLEAEHDNLRAALAACLDEPPGAEAGLRLAIALWWFWWIMGHVGEGRAWLARALARAEGAGGLLRARAVLAAGHMAWGQGDLAVAEALLEDATRQCRALDDRWGIAWALMVLGDVARKRGQVDRARARLEESARVAREGGERRVLGFALHELGMVEENQGDLARAQAHYEESLRLFREVEDPGRVALALWGLGMVTGDRGDGAAADTLLEEAQRLFAEVRDTSGVAQVLIPRGRIATERGDYLAARSYLQESARILRSVGNRATLALALRLLGRVAMEQGADDEARGLLEEALAIAREVGEPPGQAWISFMLGSLAGRRGESDAARAAYRESLRIFRELGDTESLARGLRIIGGQAERRGNRARAARILGAAEAIAGRARPAAALPSWLAEPAYIAARAEGRAMTPEQAISYALGSEGG